MTTASLTLGMTSLLLLASPVAQAETAAPCTANEVRTSDGFYHPDGTAKRTVAGQVLPKFCPTGRPANRYHSCKKDGADSALDLLHRDIDAIKSALVLSSNIYVIPDAVSDELTNGIAPVGSNYLIKWKQGRDGFQYVKDIFLPAPGTTVYFADKETRVVFSITTSSSGQHYTVAFKGTSKTWLGDWFDDVAAAGLTQIDRPIGFGVFVFETEIKRRLHIPQNVQLVKWKDTLRIPPIYMSAIAVGSQVTRLLSEAKRDCSVSVTYTGHSLGGGLALFAALMAGSRCNQKHDDLVMLNAAMPGLLTKNAEMLLGAKNSVGVVLDLNFKGEALQEVQPQKTKFLTDLASRTQVVRFNNVSNPTSPVKTVVDMAGRVIPAYTPARVLGAVSTHPIEPLYNEVHRWASTLPAPWPARIPYKQAMHACSWYEPLMQEGEGLKRKAPVKGEQYKKL